jgi:hypothetical protein
MSIRESKIVPIDWIDDEERWVLVPGTLRQPRRILTKRIVYRKENCLFAVGVPKSVIDFIYRSVRQLGLSDRTLIFSRGVVRNTAGPLKYGVSIRELDWGVGTLITIPRILKYGEHIVLPSGAAGHRVRRMELVVLIGLLKLAFPDRTSKDHSIMAALILIRGWNQLHGRK